MIRTLSSDDPTPQRDTLIDQVNEQGDEVMVESHGKPKVAVISIEAFEETQMLREQKRRADVLTRLRALQESLERRQRDLTEERAMALADRFSHEFVDELAAEGKLTFERDQQPPS
ncbi:MAG: type II toxin-antitoxin system prevent-host-death family antitoxin [Thermomicrobiales bacterium]